ncbi:MAG: sulfatase [Candidatus Sumerlaeota bacterium]|nr:sulfatase [Candidatus Sumerlaeota bacterium]
MDRRQFLRSTAAFLGGALTAALPASDARPAPASTASPNIVLFISDDHTATDCGAYGAKDVKTPNIDRLAGESLRFTQAFAASPTCTPARSSIYTGLFPMRHGAHPNHSALSPGIHTLPDYLKPLGYRTALIGKVMVKPAGQLPFDTLMPDPKVPGAANQDQATLRKSVEWLKNNKGGPFCLIVCVHDPHVPWVFDERYGYKTDNVGLEPTFVDTPATRESRAKYYSDVSRMDERLGELMDAVDKERLRDNTLFIYTADQGAQWPFAKWNLYDAGIRVPLLIRWPGKVAAGASCAALVSHVDLLPTFIEMAGGSPPADLDGRSILGLLQGRTAAHRDCIFAAHTGDGVMNVAPMRCIRTDRYKYVTTLMPEVEYTTHIDLARKEGYWETWEEQAKTDPKAQEVLTRYHWRAKEELYDLQTDPLETRNLVDDPALAATLAELRAKLSEWREQQRDDGIGLSQEEIVKLLAGNTAQKERVYGSAAGATPAPKQPRKAKRGAAP